MEHLNICILILLVGKFTLTHQYFITHQQELMLVPSVAFRHHSPAAELTAIAQSSDDWILYAQGSIALLLL